MPPSPSPPPAASVVTVSPGEPPPPPDEFVVASFVLLFVFILLVLFNFLFALPPMSSSLSSSPSSSSSSSSFPSSSSGRSNFLLTNSHSNRNPSRLSHGAHKSLLMLPLHDSTSTSNNKLAFPLLSKLSNRGNKGAGYLSNRSRSRKFANPSFKSNGNCGSLVRFKFLLSKNVSPLFVFEKCETSIGSEYGSMCFGKI